MEVGSPESDTKLVRDVVSDKVARHAEQPAAEWRDLFYLYAFLVVAISTAGSSGVSASGFGVFWPIAASGTFLPAWKRSSYAAGLTS
jgi:hypothetical protein